MATASCELPGGGSETNPSRLSRGLQRCSHHADDPMRRSSARRTDSVSGSPLRRRRPARPSVSTASSGARPCSVAPASARSRAGARGRSRPGPAGAGRRKPAARISGGGAAVERRRAPRIRSAIAGTAARRERASPSSRPLVPVVHLAQRRAQALVVVGDRHPGAGSGGAWTTASGALHASIRASSSGKWRYTVARCTPASLGDPAHGRPRGPDRPRAGAWSPR